MNKLLVITFQDVSVAIKCNDSDLRSLLFELFRHCVIETNQIIASYQVLGDELSWQLFRDHHELAQVTTKYSLINHLVHNITTLFIQHCRSGLALHAAAISVEDRAIALVGDSGSGKSTLAGHLVSKGFDYITDELSVVQAETLNVSGFQRPIMLKQGSRFLLDKWGQPPERWSFENGAFWLDPEWVRDNCVVNHKRLDVVLLLQYIPGVAFRNTKLSVGQSVFELMQKLVNSDILPNGGLTDMLLVSKQVRVYKIEYSSLEAVYEWIRNL